MVRRYARSRDPARAHWHMRRSYSYKVHPRNRRVGGRVVSDKSWSKMKRRKAQKIGLSTTGKQALGVGSFFVPGLGTYKAAKLGHKVLFGMNLVGDVTLAYWLYSQVVDNDKNSLKSPEAHVDPFLFENITHHDYVQGYNTTSISVWRTM